MEHHFRPEILEFKSSEFGGTIPIRSRFSLKDFSETLSLSSRILNLCCHSLLPEFNLSALQIQPFGLYYFFYNMGFLAFCQISPHPIQNEQCTNLIQNKYLGSQCSIEYRDYTDYVPLDLALNFASSTASWHNSIPITLFPFCSIKCLYIEIVSTI